MTIGENWIFCDKAYSLFGLSDYVSVLRNQVLKLVEILQSQTFWWWGTFMTIEAKYDILYANNISIWSDLLT